MDSWSKDTGHGVQVNVQNIYKDLNIFQHLFYTLMFYHRLTFFSRESPVFLTSHLVFIPQEDIPQAASQTRNIQTHRAYLKVCVLYLCLWNPSAFYSWFRVFPFTHFWFILPSYVKRLVYITIGCFFFSPRRQHKWCTQWNSHKHHWKRHKKDFWIKVDTG